ncbi:MBL fold metallo-hydrolase [Nocardioides carbamazepini]|uniref:MBL fold metallo-hydrolase n=1 Tax=Nocardioides carbamazepini TaxID=2854259 RepID=UPI00214A129F|nr:MBL fold metallo-hydrolase [Nocardioides carbamazepini]MCR1783997.1 MBL fold metallo-hydrolase [Nocardioides carbamazepini]
MTEGFGPPSTIRLGDVEITRIQEYAGPSTGTPGILFPDAEPSYWSDNADWLDPAFYDAASGTLRTVLNSWLIRSQGRLILLDTGAGNGKERPYAPVYAHFDNPYLDQLAAVGVAAEDIDVVINTHLHVDHVGWNTRIEGRSWVPTFPRATYLMPAADVSFWNPLENPRAPGDGNQNVFEDSVRPVLDAGLVRQWRDTLRLDESLVLEAQPGHTPGSSVLRVESGGTGALFVGDILHSPVQVAAPDVNSCWCEDPPRARSARRRVLGEAAERRLLVFPGHFGGHSACTVRAQGDGFAVDGWADLGLI